jgi:hypothetical protein
VLITATFGSLAGLHGPPSSAHVDVSMPSCAPARVDDSWPNLDVWTSVATCDRTVGATTQFSLHSTLQSPRGSDWTRRPTFGRGTPRGRADGTSSPPRSRRTTSSIAHEGTRAVYKVFLRMRDRAGYLALVDRTKSTVGGQIEAAYRFLKKRVEQLANSESMLRGFFTALATPLDFVTITLGAEDPYKILRSLNSTALT